MAAHNNIKTLRIAIGLKQWHVGEAVNCSQQQVSRLENGKRLLKKKMAEKLALLLGVTVEELYANTPVIATPAPPPVAQAPTPPEIAVVFEKFSHCIEVWKDHEQQMFVFMQEVLQQQMPKGKRRA